MNRQRLALVLALVAIGSSAARLISGASATPLARFVSIVTLTGGVQLALHAGGQLLTARREAAMDRAHARHLAEAAARFRADADEVDAITDAAHQVLAAAPFAVVLAADGTTVASGPTDQAKVVVRRSTPDAPWEVDAMLTVMPRQPGNVASWAITRPDGSVLASGPCPHAVTIERMTDTFHLHVPITAAVAPLIHGTPVA